jgi:hypothetical protein
VLTHIDQLDVRQLGVLENSGRRVGDEDLAAVRRIADPGGAMDSETYVSIVSQMGLGRMKSDPHAHVRAFRRHERREFDLGADSCEGGALRAVESDEEGVSCRVDLAPVLRCKRLPEDPAVLGAYCGEPVVAQPPHKLGRSLDVAEEERHSPARERRTIHSGETLTFFLAIDQETGSSRAF